MKKVFFSSKGPPFGFDCFGGRVSAQVQSNRMETTWTSGNMLRISKHNRKLMQKLKNMTKSGHEVGSEKSQTYVKSGLPEEPSMKIRECQEAESLHRWGVEEQLVCKDTANEEADEYDDRFRGSVEVTIIEISEEPMKVGWDVTRYLICVKTGDVEEHNERREFCTDDAIEPIQVKVADIVKLDETAESIGRLHRLQLKTYMC